MTGQLKYLNDDNFGAETKEGVTLVDFYADWCGPCRMMEPVIDELAAAMQGKATIAKLDIEESQKVTADFNVTSIPTLILFKDGQEVQRIVGVKDKDALQKIIEGAL